MKNLSIDLETFSSADLTKTGVYKYVESPDFEILLFGYSVDGGEVEVVDLAAGERIPADILAALTDESILKWAFNASFERICLSRFLGLPTGKYLDPDSWRCSMVWSAYMGLPLSLEGVGGVLGLEQQKMREGKDLIRFFCKPCRQTIKNGGRTRNFYFHDEEKWELFKTYNKRDVETELAIQQRLRKFPVPDDVWKEYHLSERINDRGICVDTGFVSHAIARDLDSGNDLRSRLQQITALRNPNSVSQMKDWLSKKGLETESLDKKAVIELLKDCPEELREALIIRQQLAKSSVKKYTAMENAVCADDRVRGMFQFYGANRTGRFAGRLVQLQNLPQNHIDNLSDARDMVGHCSYRAISREFDSVPDVLSELVRTAFVPQSGKKFIVADFSAIEARVIAWFAGESWRNELFASGGDIYCRSASEMFGVPVVKNGVNGHLRQKGKVAELACIAEGSLVLTDKGLVPIETVTTDMKLWDGESWIAHDGVIFKGIREVISYDGLTATADHLVWVEGKSKPIPLGLAATSGAYLRKTGSGAGGKPVNHQREARVYDIRNAGPYHRFTVSDCLVHNCGYGGSVGALKAMGAITMGLAEEELQPLVNAWRNSNPNIVRFWWDVDSAVKTAIKQKTAVETHGIRFTVTSGMLFITLPSGRALAYAKPRIGENRFGGESVTYEGVGQTRRWERIESYGPKFVENIVQATSRDILMYAMKTLQDYPIVAHVHDEVIIEADKDVSLDTVCSLMGRTPPWAPGLVLRADGYECDFYKKE